MKILVTGAAGFIGSNLVKSLVNDGYEVFGIDNLSYGLSSNLSVLKSKEKFHFIYGDICNEFIYNEVKVDVIVHLASQKIPRYSNALRTLDENGLMLNNVIKKCLRDGSKLVFASTSDVYGKNPDIPFSEESNLVLGPPTIKRWAYALSKMSGEHLIIANGDQYGLKYSIARFFGSYGPNQNLTWWGGPQSVFIEKALKNKTIEIHGNGLQTRTFTYIDDTIQGLKFLILNEKANGHIFNIGSFPEDEISILKLAGLIWSIVNGHSSKPKLKFIPYETFGNYEDVIRRVPDISKIQSFFGYAPATQLYDGLQKTIEWQKSQNPMK